jgi:WD40 repeat protein
MKSLHTLLILFLVSSCAHLDAMEGHKKESWSELSPLDPSENSALLELAALAENPDIVARTEKIPNSLPLRNMLQALLLNPISYIKIKGDTYQKLAWHPAGNYLTYTKRSNETNTDYLAFFDVVTKKPFKNELDIKGRIRSFAWSANAHHCALLYLNGDLRVVEVIPDGDTLHLRNSTEIAGEIRKIVWSACGRYVAGLLFSGSRIVIYDTQTREDSTIFLDDDIFREVDKMIFDGKPFGKSSDALRKMIFSNSCCWGSRDWSRRFVLGLNTRLYETVDLSAKIPMILPKVLTTMVYNETLPDENKINKTVINLHTASIAYPAQEGNSVIIASSQNEGLDNKRCIPIHKDGTGTVKNLKWSPDGKTLMVVDTDGRIVFINPEDRYELSETAKKPSLTAWHPKLPWFVFLKKDDEINYFETCGRVDDEIRNLSVASAALLCATMIDINGVRNKYCCLDSFPAHFKEILHKQLIKEAPKIKEALERKLQHSPGEYNRMFFVEHES